MKRKALSILLLTAMFLPMWGGYLWLMQERAGHQKQVHLDLQTKSERTERVLLRFAKSEEADLLDWEHSREFEFEGQMYDVIRSEERGDSSYYWCYPDRKEDRIKKQLAELSARLFAPDPLKTEKQQRILTFFQTLFHPGSESGEALRPALLSFLIVERQNICQHLGNPPPSPPPERA